MTRTHLKRFSFTEKLASRRLNTSHTTWDLSPLFTSDTDPAMVKAREQISLATEGFINKWHPKKAYLKDVDALLEALNEYEAWQGEFSTSGNVGYYFWLRTQQDQNDPDLKAGEQQINDFSNDLQNRIQFFELDVAKLDAEMRKKVLADERFKSYYHFLDRLFAHAQYQLSEPEERIMNLKSDAAYRKWVDMVEAFISNEEREVPGEDGKKAKLSFEGLLTLCSSGQKTVRDQAADCVNEILDKHAPVAEAELNAILNNKKVDDEVRGYERPDTARHVADDFDTAVVDSLITAVAGRNDIANRFYALKAKLLGEPKLAYHERNVEYGKVEKDYSFEEACELVHRVCQRLDPQFAEILERFLERGQIDVFPRVGKRGGAMCAYNLISQPTYMLLNFTGKLRDVTTLAHELGHGINDEFMRVQNSLNFGTPLATAEVASQFLEDFVLDEITAGADDELKLAILMNRLNDGVSAVFRQAACYQFEQALHGEYRKTGYLSRQQIGELFQKHMQAYMGESVEQSKGSENWWVYWSHIRVFFYVYSYAGGLLIARAMQAGVRKDPAYIEKVKSFLAGGSSISPKELFHGLGIDITDAAFWNDGLEQTAKMVEEAEKLAAKLGKTNAPTPA